MSEYQYYEFLAIDRPLTPRQMEQVRAYSSRAEISAISFINEYEWGDFRGDPKDFLRRFFDVFIYLANWGTRRLMFRVPAEGVEAAELKAYADSDIVHISSDKAGEFLLIDIDSNPEDGGGDWCDPTGMMASFSPIRAEVMSGDLRALYIGWLHGLQYCELADARLEPPIPAGLRSLTAAQQGLIDFLEVDGDLFDVAAQASLDRTTTAADDQGMRNWLIALPTTEKDDLLLRLVDGSDPPLAARLRQRYQRAFAPPPPSARTGRTVSQLLTLARQRAEDRQAAAAIKKKRDEERRAAEAAAARAEHLRHLSGRQEDAWREVEALIGLRQKTTYEQAVALLVDLREIAVAAGELGGFNSRVEALQQLHHKKGNLIGLMVKAGLTARPQG